MSEPGRIRVLVADDHPLAHMGMRHFVEAYPELELVGEAGNGMDAVELCERTRPDVVLMDMLMPGVDGVAATRQIKERHPSIRVIVLTSYHDGTMVEQAMRAGASGYLLKTATPHELMQAIRQTIGGRSVLAPEVAETLLGLMSQRDQLGTDLTDRELEVLRLLALGRSNQQIADQLKIARSTVKFHIGSLFAKLGVASRAEAIALAYQQKLV
ncbi:MAG: response regulator transcription factor [Chloroflexi bacterium OHK40]